MSFTSINSRLKEVRKAMGMTQKAFSDMLKLKQSYYSEVESGKRGVTFRILSQLIEKDGVNANWLFTGTGEMMIEKSNKESRVISTNNEDLTSHKSYNKMSGSSVGVHVGLDEKRPVEIDWIHRVQTYLKRENPDDYTLFKDFLLLSNFQDFIEEFERKIIRPLWLIEADKKSLVEQGKFSYKDYREEFLRTLQSFSHLKPAVSKLASAVRQFYSEFQPFDNENLVEDYYENGE